MFKTQGTTTVHPRLVKSVDAKPVDTEGRLYSKMKTPEQTAAEKENFSKLPLF